MGDKLDRRIGPWLLTAYGVGVMVGAGIYVLIGAVGAEAGRYAPLAFVIAAIVALPAALSYAELSTRMPEAAGEVAYVERGFGQRWMGVVVGAAVVVSATISAAAVLRGGVGYLLSLVALPHGLAILGFGLLLTAIAIVGVLESLIFIAVFTVVEVAGLIIVASAGVLADPVIASAVADQAINWTGVFGAVALCIFAFIGFEDLANMAEEAITPSRTMPIAIMSALCITAVLYAFVAYAAVRVVPIHLLGQSEQPLSLVWEYSTGRSATFLAMIAVMAAINGVLAQIVMAARVLFGLGRRANILKPLSHVHPRFGTPARATVMIGACVIGAAFLLPVGTLAEITAMVLLCIFLLVNAALIAIKRTEPKAQFRVPMMVPIVGVVFASAAIAMNLGLAFQ